MPTRYVIDIKHALGGLNRTVRGLADHEGKPVEIAVLVLGAVNLLISISYAAMSIAYDLRYLADAKQAADKREGFVGADGPAPNAPREGG